MMKLMSPCGPFAHAGAALVLTFGLALGASTSTTPGTLARTTSPIAESSPGHVSTRSSGWPRHPRVVATVRAPEPPADDVLLPQFKSIFLAAYNKACLDVTSVEEATRALGPRTWLIMIRCGQEPVRAVRLIFTSVVVPDLHRDADQLGMSKPQDTLRALGLRWRIRYRAAKAGEQPGTVVSQRPLAGAVVPFGTTISFVIAR